MYREKTAEREPFPPGTKRALYNETNGRCAHCGAGMPYADATVDHAVPISKGGSNGMDNLAILCGACNLEKYNHVIEPKGYYRYLPEDRLARLQANFEKYLESAEWLGWENLFRTDRFELRAKRAVVSGKSGKMFMAPMSAQIRKLLPADAYDWLQLYRAHIRPVDRCLIISDPRDIEHPFYEISSGGRPIAVFECYMDIDDGLVSDEGLPRVTVNFFPHWDLRRIPPASDYTLFYVVKAVAGQIQDTISRSAKRSLVAFRFTGVGSDPHIKPLLGILPKEYMHPFFQSNFKGLDPEAETAGFTAILFQGGRSDIRDMMREAGAASEKDLYSAADRPAMAAPVLDALSGQQDDVKPDRILYSDMTGGYGTKRHGRKHGKRRR